ncbi:MBL fold metallo-hydrolase [Streptomyces griseorubiginosus]|uniref:MBL fold metallo-hydrolase n=1 Tax=Streptomyces griseorubiginosus TaxID=67304 RepID=UPI0033A8EC1D
MNHSATPDTSTVQPTVVPELPVVEAWFTARAVDESITLIVEPYVHPFLQANIWHIRGRDRNLLIDCGLGVASLRTALPNLFDRETVLVLTHAHLDHMGSAHEFEHCWAHPAEPVMHPLAGTLKTRALFTELGMDPEQAADEPELLISARPHADYAPGDYRLNPAGVTKTLEEGDLIDLGDRQLSVLHLPGHTPGSIALLDSRRGILFSGDVVYDGELLDEIDGADVDEYVNTMRRLRRLPVTVVHPGHGPSFARSRLRELAAQYIAEREGRRPGGDLSVTNR